MVERDNSHLHPRQIRDHAGSCLRWTILCPSACTDQIARSSGGGDGVNVIGCESPKAQFLANIFRERGFRVAIAVCTSFLCRCSRVRMPGLLRLQDCFLYAQQRDRGGGVLSRCAEKEVSRRARLALAVSRSCVLICFPVQATQRSSKQLRKRNMQWAISPRNL